MHRLLERQLRKAFGDAGPPAGMADFLASVEAAYSAADDDRALLERSMDLTSAELQDGNRALRQHIEELKQVQDRLAASEAAYRRLIMTATEGLWTIDQDDRIIFVNQTMCQWLGRREQDILGRKPRDFVERGQDAVAPRLTQAASVEAPRFELALRAADGSTRWMLVSASPVADAEGNVQGALQMFADITARKATEDALREAYASLEQADSARQAFINAAAHELGTPLTPIRLQIHAMKRKAQGELAQNVEVLERNVDRIILLVDDLLDSVKIQTDRMDVRRDLVDISELVEAAAASFAEVARQKGIQLDVDVVGQLPVAGDRRRLEQVLDNLLSNATKFTPAGGRIQVRTGRDGDLAWFQVTDSGMGIAKADLRRMFQPFVQVHEDTVGHGTGLGLYIARSIMQAMGGTLDATSPGLGKGATLRAMLPAADAISKA